MILAFRFPELFFKIIVQPMKIFLPAVLMLAALGALNSANSEHNLIPFSNAHSTGVVEIFPEWWGEPPSSGQLAECRDSSKCATCHRENARMDVKHAIACVNCHGGNGDSEDKRAAHEGLISDPGALSTIDNTCGKCHPDIALKVKNSAMALCPRIINQTLFAFGAKSSSQPPYGTVGTVGAIELPDPSAYFEKIAETGQPSTPSNGVPGGDLPELCINLGADLLRRSCLRCHLNGAGSKRTGESKGSGCSACHVAYSNRSQGKPAFHAIVRNVGVTACLKCHNSNHVGSDFVGLYEKDHNRGFKSPVVSGHQAPTIYGSEQHRLVSDSHFKASMICSDCHTLNEIHGSGNPLSGTKKNVRISCRGCHVSGDHPSVKKDEAGNSILMTRKKARAIPAWKSESVSHAVNAHREHLTCSSCHSAWSYQDYGLNLMLDERNEYWKWSINSSQNDPQVQALLKKYVGSFADLIPPQGGKRPSLPEEEWQTPRSFDWLSNVSRIGIWYRGWTLRRWSNPPLGLDSHGKVSVLRPMRQYVISYVDKNERLILDSHLPTTGSDFPALIANPYTPHTTTRFGRTCQDCHGSFKAAGMGEVVKGIEKPTISPLIRQEDQVSNRVFRWDAFVDDRGNPQQFSVYAPPAGPLSKKLLEGLLNPSIEHKTEWSRNLLN